MVAVFAVKAFAFQLNTGVGSDEWKLEEDCFTGLLNMHFLTAVMADSLAVLEL